MSVCPKCDKHFRIDARTRLAQLLDDNQYETFDGDISSTDPLKFVDLKAYSSRLKQAQKDTGLKDAVINAQGKLMGKPVVASVMEYSFIGGSMGAVVGEAITRAVERAASSRTPLDHCVRVGRCAHDGGRDQPDAVGENFVGVGAAGCGQSSVYFLADRSDDRGCDGVLRDVRRLEYCGAGSADRICGTAGDRTDDPAETAAGFQRAEFLLEHGMLDAVVRRKEMKGYISRALDFMVGAAA